MSIISAIFLKKSFFEYWQKIDFFQFFPHFHKDFSKDFLTKLVKASIFRGSILISEYLKDVLRDDRRIQQIFLQSTFSQHLLIQTKIIQNRPVYENLWNDDVRSNLWTIFEVDHKLILYLNGMDIKSRYWIFLLQLASPPGKYQLVNHTLPKIQPLDFK